MGDQCEIGYHTGRFVFRVILPEGYEVVVLPRKKHTDILGATGKREDHTLGNLSLLSIYAGKVPSIRIVTDYGCFTVAKKSGRFESFAGMQISIIPLAGPLEVSSRNLKYPMQKLLLKHWYQATLNEALGDSFELDFPAGGELLIYRTFKGK